MASTLSPTPIARSALTACGLTLTAAPISPSAGAVSNTSAAMPNIFSALAVASPARPPPTIAILQLDDISCSSLSTTSLKHTLINRDARHLYDPGPAALLLRQVGRQLLGRGRPRQRAHLGKCLLQLVAGERAGDAIADLLADRQRRARRGDQTGDRCGDELVEADLHQGRNVGRERTA